MYFRRLLFNVPEVLSGMYIKILTLCMVQETNEELPRVSESLKAKDSMNKYINT
jgi:hypothetical protein